MSETAAETRDGPESGPLADIPLDQVIGILVVKTWYGIIQESAFNSIDRNGT
jgi:hypothetical protein